MTHLNHTGVSSVRRYHPHPRVQGHKFLDPEIYQPSVTVY